MAVFVPLTHIIIINLSIKVMLNILWYETPYIYLTNNRSVASNSRSYIKLVYHIYFDYYSLFCKLSPKEKTHLCPTHSCSPWTPTVYCAAAGCVQRAGSTIQHNKFTRHSCYSYLHLYSTYVPRTVGPKFQSHNNSHKGRWGPAAPS